MIILCTYSDLKNDDYRLLKYYLVPNGMKRSHYPSYFGEFSFDIEHQFKKKYNLFQRMHS